MGTLKKLGLERIRWSIGVGSRGWLTKRTISGDERVFATLANNVSFSLVRHGDVVASGTVSLDERDGRFIVSHYEVDDCELNADLLNPAVTREVALIAAETFLVETTLHGDEIELPQGYGKQSLSGTPSLSSDMASAVQRKGRPRLSDEVLTEVHKVYTSAEDRARLTAVRKRWGLTQSRAQNWVAASRRRLPELWEESK